MNLRVLLRKYWRLLLVLVVSLFVVIASVRFFRVVRDNVIIVDSAKRVKVIVR